MLGLERVVGLRVVADPEALDGATWDAGMSTAARSGAARPVVVFRIAPDEAFGLAAETVDVDDPHAIVEPEHGFVLAELDRESLERIGERLEWPLPAERPVLAQGNIAGVPAKLLLRESGDMLLVAAAHAVELEGRLG